MIEAVPFLCSPPRKKGLRCREVQHLTVHSAMDDYVGEKVSRKKKLVNGVCQVIKRKRTPRPADSDTLRDIGDGLEPYVPAEVGQKVEKDEIQPADEVIIKTLWLLSYYAKTV